MALMPNNLQTPEIVYTPEFKRNLRQLAKKYRHIKSDVQPIIEDLTRGRMTGDKIGGKGRLRSTFSGSEISS